MRRLEHGMSLLEVIVALLLLAMGMLGFVALQTSSVKLTTESIDRTQALTVMQSTAEKIRTNSSTDAMNAYKQGFSDMKTRTGVANKNNTVPAHMCGLNGTTARSCGSADLARADIHLFAKQFMDNGLVANIVTCPRNSGKAIASSDCMIIAWGNTNPTVGADQNTDCLSSTGSYYPSASCMFMEMN